MSTSIFSADCPSCGTTSWVNSGDLNDLTAPDVDAVRCYRCSHEFVPADMDYGQELEQVEATQGYETPNLAVYGPC